MSKPRYRWWGYVRTMIRDYPKLKAAPALTHDDRTVLEAVKNASGIIDGTDNGPEKLKLIHLMYWVPRPMPGKSAALHLNIAEITAKRWHGEFVRQVARSYGFTLDDD